ncbi:MAG: hypothetical protein P1U65_17990 [Minwuia sp.]|nr:hypothetical protein [Minwuia sp.]
MTDSLIDYASASGDDTPRDVSPPPAAPKGADTYRYTLDGATHDVPVNFWDPDTQTLRLGSLLKSHGDLRTRMGQQQKAPESYEIQLPDDLKDAMTANPDDPLAKSAMDWARKHGLSQEAFNELAEAFFRNEAGAFDADAYRTDQLQALEEHLGGKAEHVRQEVGQWFGALMGQDFKDDPELLAAAEDLAADARGVLLLKTLRDRLTERGVPDTRGGESGRATDDEASLRRLQASDAYQREGHPDHATVVRRVQEGWARVARSGS